MVLVLRQMMMQLFPALLLVVALSLDALVASFAYGNSRIKIPLGSALIVNLVCTASLALSLLLGSVIRPYLEATTAAWLSFAVLFLLGLVKLCDSSIKALIRRKKIIDKQLTFQALHLHFILHVYANPQDADQDSSKILSRTEAASLAIALSLDGMAVGFGAGLADFNIWIVLAISLLAHLLAICGGAWLGQKLAHKSTCDLSWLSGILLLILAFARLF
jgi:putative sporulation protein YtaF